MDKARRAPHIGAMAYRAPLDDMLVTLRAGAGFDAALGGGHLGEVDADLIIPILEEAGKIAADIIAPLNRDGDRIGARMNEGQVVLPPGWREAYRLWCAGGWNGLAAPQPFGGQGLPFTLNAPCLEMWNAAAMAFALCPLLTAGAIDAIAHHASADLQALYLPKLISGEWTGTMLLTEPQAGSDVGALTASATPSGDGTYRLKGTKIFITYGEHDLAANIIHLVLARLPGAPAGTRGISLFLVPKFLPDAEGTPGARNDIHATSLEHKLGIHASPTCVMVLGDETGAIGYLIGEENRGMACMFTMMNQARLGVGLQGVGLAERATQEALAYAGERKQGRAPNSHGTGADPIIAHPDVRRMVMQMQALTSAARAICYANAMAIDMAARTTDASLAQSAAARAALLTPMAKAFSTDIANEVTSLGVQVHGGLGYIEETGAAQLMRDARIAAIYEGTNGIQAIDLLTRKLCADDGAAVTALVNELREIAGAAKIETRLVRAAEALETGLALLQTCATDLIARARGDLDGALAGASAFLRLASIVTGGALLMKNAIGAAHQPGLSAQPARHLALAQFFADHILTQAPALAASIANAAHDGERARALLDPDA